MNFEKLEVIAFMIFKPVSYISKEEDKHMWTEIVFLGGVKTALFFMVGVSQNSWEKNEIRGVHVCLCNYCLQDGQNFKNLLISIALEKWDPSGPGSGMSQCISATRAWWVFVTWELLTFPMIMKQCVQLITVVCSCSHILKLSMTQLQKSCLSASHHLLQRMKSSDLQGWACWMNVICFCGTRGCGGCWLVIRFVKWLHGQHLQTSCMWRCGCVLDENLSKCTSSLSICVRKHTVGETIFLLSCMGPVSHGPCLS